METENKDVRIMGPSIEFKINGKRIIVELTPIFIVGAIITIILLTKRKKKQTNT